MQKLLFGIFAHPDDEAFGVSPTLIKEVDEGAILHLVALTAGENGTNPDNVEDLGKTRLEEWQYAGQLLGAASLTHLGYTDGTLANKDVLDISASIQQLVQSETEGSHDETIIEFITFDESGLTGHIDHIVATRAALHAFYTLKASYPDRMRRVRLRCLPKTTHPSSNVEWLYMNAGLDDSAIDEVVDASAYRQKVLSVMEAHHSQRHDAATHILREGHSLCMNYFVVRK